MELIAKGVTIIISGEPVTIDISTNEDGNLVLQGIGAVFFEMWEEELVLTRATQ